MKRVLIVIPVFDRLALIKQTLNSLYENTEHPFELRIGSDSGEEKIKHFLYGFLNGKRNMTAIHRKESLGEMRNLNGIIRDASEWFNWDYLVRCDDDIYFNRGWLGHMLRTYQANPDVAILGGAAYPLHKVLERRGGMDIMDVAAGCHWLLSREIWNEFGPFYEDFVEGDAEDRRFCRAAQKAGYEVACLSDPTYVVHCGLVGSGKIGQQQRSKKVIDYTHDLCKKVGAIYN